MSSASSTQSLRSAIDSLTEALRRGELVLVVGPEALTVSIEDAGWQTPASALGCRQAMKRRWPR